jgi:hypothetical protein
MPDAAPNTVAPGASPGGFQPGVRADATPSPLSDADFDGAGAPGKPSTAEAYKLELPSDFKAPDGVEIRFDASDPVRGPILNEARQLAHSLGVDQAGFSKLLALQARLEANEAQRANDLAIIEQRAIGADYESRKQALNAVLDRTLSKQHADELRRGIGSRLAFEALEQLIAKAMGRSPASSASPSSNGKSWADRMWPNGFDPNPQRAR